MGQVLSAKASSPVVTSVDERWLTHLLVHVTIATGLGKTPYGTQTIDRNIDIMITLGCIFPCGYQCLNRWDTPMIVTRQPLSGSIVWAT